MIDVGLKAIVSLRSELHTNMSCIAGLCVAGDVYLCGDSISHDEVTGLIDIRASKKVYALGSEIVVGFAGSWKLGQVIQCSFKPPKLPVNITEKWMFMTLMPKLLESLTASSTTVEDSAILIGVRDKLFFVDSDMSVYESDETYFAIGAGAAVALGALHALTNVGTHEPQVIVESAIRAAAYHHSVVRPPYTTVTTSGKKFVSRV